MIDLQKVVQNVTEWAEMELQEFIQHYVYDFGETRKKDAKNIFGQEPIYYNGTGHATGQFKRSITHDTLHEDLENYIGYMIFSDPTKMQYLGEKHLHGTKTHDFRATLIERLNDAEDDIPEINARWRWWTERQPFFDLYLDYLNRHIYQRFEIEMSKVGMKWKKEGHTDGKLI